MVNLEVMAKTTMHCLEPAQRVKINKHRCVVCGAPSVTFKGKRFYQTGRSMFGAPFCKEHAAHFKEYAAPVFENITAQELYKYMYPKTYQRNVEGKLVLYFSTYKTGIFCPCNDRSSNKES